MKITNEVVAILKNFATINPSIYITKGNSLSTISDIANNIRARAEIEESFTHDFGIYDLSRFLNVMSLYDEPTITCHESYLDIGGSDKNKTTTYFYANKEYIKKYEGKVKKLPDPIASINITKDVLQEIQKSSNILQVPDLVIKSDGEKVLVKIFNKDVETSNVHMIDMDIDPKGVKYNFFIKIDLIEKMIPIDYQMDIIGERDDSGSMIMMGCFKNSNQDTFKNLEYLVAVEFDSTFEE